MNTESRSESLERPVEWTRDGLCSLKGALTPEREVQIKAELEAALRAPLSDAEIVRYLRRERDYAISSYQTPGEVFLDRPITRAERVARVQALPAVRTGEVQVTFFSDPSDRPSASNGGH